MMEQTITLSIQFDPEQEDPPHLWDWVSLIDATGEVKLVDAEVATSVQSEVEAVTIIASSGPLGTIEVMDEDQDDEDAESGALRQAAVAWNFLMRNAQFSVRGHTFTASECAEWWA